MAQSACREDLAQALSLNNLRTDPPSSSMRIVGCPSISIRPNRTNPPNQAISLAPGWFLASFWSKVHSSAFAKIAVALINASGV